MKLHQTEDEEKAEIDEADGHFKAARKMEAEADALEAARKKAQDTAKGEMAAHHDEKEKHAAAAAKGAAKKGIAQMHGALFEQLKARVQVVAHAEAVKAAQDAAKAEINAASKKFEVQLHAKMVADARKDGKAAALAAAKVEIAKHHDKFGKVTKAVADQAKKDVKKMAEKMAEKEVKKRAGKAAHGEVSKRVEAQAHAEVLKASAAYKADMGHLADQMSKKQLHRYKTESARAAKHGVELIPPESKKVEEEKLMYILQTEGPAKALADAHQDVIDAKDEAAEASHLLGVARTQSSDSEADIASMKTPEEKKLARKVASDAKREFQIAEVINHRCNANLKQQEEVKAHTDKMVKDYEGGKQAQVGKTANEANANRHKAAAAKHAAATALAQAKCTADKKKAKKALGKAKAADKKCSKHSDKVDKAIKATAHATDKTPEEKKSGAQIVKAKATARKVGKAEVLHEKAKEIAQTTKSPTKKAVATSLVNQARAAVSKAKSNHEGALKAAGKAASKCAPAKAAHDKKKLKKETELEYKLGRLTASCAAVGKDISVVVKLKTADAAQALIDMGKLKADLAKTPKLHISDAALLRQAKRDQKKAEKLAVRAHKDEKKAVKKAKTPAEKKKALGLLKRGRKAAKHAAHALKKNIRQMAQKRH